MSWSERRIWTDDLSILYTSIYATEELRNHNSQLSGRDNLDPAATLRDPRHPPKEERSCLDKLLETRYLRKDLTSPDLLRVNLLAPCG